MPLPQECQAAGITFLSIAHRPALKRFHSVIVHFDANVSTTGARAPHPTPGAALTRPPLAPPALHAPARTPLSSLSLSQRARHGCVRAGRGWWAETLPQADSGSLSSAPSGSAPARAPSSGAAAATTTTTTTNNNAASLVRLPNGGAATAATTSSTTTTVAAQGGAAPLTQALLAAVSGAGKAAAGGGEATSGPETPTAGAPLLGDTGGKAAGLLGLSAGGAPEVSSSSRAV